MNLKLEIFYRSLMLYARSWRLKAYNKGYLTDRIEQKSGGIVAIWHGHILPLTYSMRGHDVISMASQSEDGELITNLLERWQYEMVRGSSSRGGVKALIGMKKYMDAGRLCALTVDGPLGPKNVVKPGIVFLAKLAGVPVIPVILKTNWYKRFDSWDKFVLPLPFAQVEMHVTEPIYFERESDHEADRKQLEQIMLERTNEIAPNLL
jgi:lysophospholipid acyltransferase (LPLAT)-like uncharacterized protein